MGGDLDCKRIKKAALELARAAGEIQMRKWGKRLDIRWKGATDPVTEVDKACEALALKVVSRNFPDHAFVGEETGVHGDPASPIQWFVDPLDGTVNYSHGLPQFSVSIGVREKGRGLIGVVHAPALKETYVAEAGKGAFLNGRRVRVSRRSRPDECLLVSGFSYRARETGENTREWMEFMRGFQALRRLGCASLDYCWTAAGRFEGFWEYGLKAWDNAAGELVVREAGGKVSNLEGRPLDITKPGVLATNGLIHARCLATLKRALGRDLRWKF